MTLKERKKKRREKEKEKREERTNTASRFKNKKDLKFDLQRREEHPWQRLLGLLDVMANNFFINTCGCPMSDMFNWHHSRDAVSTPLTCSQLAAKFLTPSSSSLWGPRRLDPSKKSLFLATVTGPVKTYEHGISNLPHHQACVCKT